MNPPVHKALNVPAVTAFVGSRIHRTRAPQNVIKPYIVWRIVGGSPLNNLSCDPEMDDARVRVWSYTDEAAGSATALALSQAIETALEAVTHVIFGPVDEFEEATRTYTWICDAEFWTPRPS